MIRAFGIWSLMVFTALLCLVGCGGSGGGLNSVRFFVTPNWTGSGGIAGQSLEARLVRLDGTTYLGPELINRTGGPTEIAFDGVTPGIYRVELKLYAGSDGLGGVAGVCNIVQNVNSEQRLRPVVGAAATAVSVTPASSQIQVPRATRYAAAGKTSTNALTFLPLNGLTWSNTGPATISVDGCLAPTAAGSGQVRATLGATQGTATFNASNSTPKQTRWTVLVYMNAANDLEQFAENNVDQMERVAGTDNVRFVVQWKESTNAQPGSDFNVTRRMVLEGNNVQGVQSPTVQNLGSGVDMGSAQTLQNFIAWGKANYPADKYCLVFWNHGRGWRRLSAESELRPLGVSYDDETGNAIQTHELSLAVGPGNFDIIAFDASLMQMLEVATELRNKTPYVVGSEESPPGGGYPYDVIFAKFKNTPNASLLDLTKSFCDGLVDLPAYATSKLTQSSIETAKLGPVITSVNNLATAMLAERANLQTIVPAARLAAQGYGSRTYRDLWDLTLKIENSAGCPTTVKSACAQVRVALFNAIAYNRNNNRSPNSFGLAIEFSASGPYTSLLAADYGLLQLAQLTAWDDWLALAP
jgi:hypothetical protein